MTEPPRGESFTEIQRMVTTLYEAYATAARGFLKAVGGVGERTQDDYMLVPDPIEEQVKPAIEEPTEFGSIVRAVCAYGTDSQLWQRSYGDGKHYWESEQGVVDVWSDLTDVEVLRVGIGEQSDEWQRLDVANAQTEAYSRGYEDGVASNRPSPVDRSNIKSAIREAIAKITMREGRLIGEDHSYELADAVMKVMADEPATQRFCSLRRDCRMADGHQGACQP